MLPSAVHVLLSESDLHITLSRLYLQQQERNNLSTTTIGLPLSPLVCQSVNDGIRNQRMAFAGGFHSL